MNTRVFRAGADRFRKELRVTAGDPNRALVELQVIHLVTFLTIGALTTPGPDDGTPVTSPSSVTMIFMMLVMGHTGALSVAQSVIAARDDGTLLRLRCAPAGLPSFLVGKTLLVLFTSLLSLTLLLIVAFALIGLPAHASPVAWFSALAFITLGMLLFTAVGAVFGAVLPDARESLGYSILPFFVFALFAGTGVATMLPDWVRNILHILPFEWLVNGINAGLTADTPIGFPAEDWNPAVAFLVVGSWTAVLLAIAVPLLRRMTQRTSGSDVSRRQKRAQDRALG